VDQVLVWKRGEAIFDNVQLNEALAESQCVDDRPSIHSSMSVWRQATHLCPVRKGPGSCPPDRGRFDEPFCQCRPTTLGG